LLDRLQDLLRHSERRIEEVWAYFEQGVIASTCHRLVAKLASVKCLRMIELMTSPNNRNQHT
jgi:hypothetical protein